MFFLAYREHQPFAEEKSRQDAVRTAVVCETEDPLNRTIDFDMLKKINPDIVGWVYIPQIGVDSPVLKGNTDSQYLTRSFDGEYSPLGSVFTYSHTDKKLSDPHVCLFGHNMPSGQMFGQLPRFRDEDFCQENRKYWLYTPDCSKEIEIETVFEAEKDDEVFQDDWGKEKEDSQTVTLATCSGYDSTSLRIAVNGVVKKEKFISIY